MMIRYQNLLSFLHIKKFMQTVSILFCFIISGLTIADTGSQVTLPSGLHSEEFEYRNNWPSYIIGSDRNIIPPCIVLLNEDSTEAISRRKSWRNTPFMIGSKTYDNGIAFNAKKHLRIYLDKPGARFASDIGLENNDDTQNANGKGSVTFHVIVAGKEVYSSPVLKLKDEPGSIDIPLNGSKEFDIIVGDGGDGRDYDQALWANAEIYFQDGSRLSLQDLPLNDNRYINPNRISFIYGGKPGSSLLQSWKRQERESTLPEGTKLHEVSWLDPETGLEVFISSKNFTDFPAAEWSVKFNNTGTKDTPLLENIHILDSDFALPETKPAKVHWATGGVASFDDFAPHIAELKPGEPFSLTTKDGRSSSEYLPFFNLEGDGAGIVMAIGWTGKWTADFNTGQNGNVHVTTGMSRTHLILHPGEEIQMPRMLTIFYKGDRWRGQNLLRRYILKYHRPMKQGKPLISPITFGNWGGTSGEVHLTNITNIIRERLPMEYYWIDAGWYGTPEPDPAKSGLSWASNVGDWKIKTSLYPQGFKMLSDTLHKDKRELMMWFEPERVYKNTPWHKEHPEWLLDIGGDSLLMNLGNPEARIFVTDFISKCVSDFGLGCYRQDFNINPSEFWDKNDTPDRQGISEIRYIEGLYAFWDGILARDPNLIIDNCASGGRRIDIETTGRGIPYWRTDGPRDPIAHQCHTYGLLAWVPFSATSQDKAGDDYEFRSSMCSSLCINWEAAGDGAQKPYRKDFPYDWARKTLNQYVSIRDNYCGDYYPLTEYSKSDSVWMAYQLDRPESGQGLIVALRRPNSPYDSAHFVLHGLDAGADYVFTDLDTNKVTKIKGAELMKSGLSVNITSKPGSALIRYQREKQ